MGSYGDFSWKFPRPRHVTQGHTRVTQAHTELSSIKISWKIVMMPKIEKVITIWLQIIMICWFLTFLFFLKFQISNAISYFNCSTLCCCIWWKGEKAEVTQPWWSCLQTTKRSRSQFFLRGQTPVDMHFLKECYVFSSPQAEKIWSSNSGCSRWLQLKYLLNDIWFVK